MRAFWMIVALLASPAWAHAQTNAETIVVHPPAALEQRTLAFAERLTAPMGPAAQLPRWSGSVCPGMLGMSPEAAQAVVDRIGQRAQSLGLGVGAPGCRVNILMIFTNDVSEALDVANARQRRGMGVGSDDRSSRGRAAWRDFQETSRPVRWWHVSRAATADGVGAERQAGGETMPMYDGGYTRSATRLDFESALVIIDAGRIRGTQLVALSDYLAFVALAQINPEADVSALPSILNLFSAGGGSRPGELTPWDQAYLVGLYGSREDVRSTGAQERQIGHEMALTLR